MRSIGGHNSDLHHSPDSTTVFTIARWFSAGRPIHFMKTFHTTLAASSFLLLSGCATLDSGNTRQTHTIPASELLEVDTLQATAAGIASETSLDPVKQDFWEQLRQGMQLQGSQQQAVRKQIRIYSRIPSQVEEILQRGEPYLAYIHQQVMQRGFPAEITLLPFVESGYDPFAYSHGRAAGLWQFIPGTGKQYDLKQDWWYDGRRDIIASTTAAMDHLDKLQQEFDGDWLLALAAYNSGSGTVRKAIRKNREAGRPTNFWHLALPGETSAYVPRLLAISAIVRQPQQYGITLLPIGETPDFTVVKTGGQLDIGIAAGLADLEVDELYALNPAFNRWATHPDGPHRLLLPTEKAGTFQANLEALPDSQRMKWVRHKVRSGDTLSHIAQRYDTTVNVLRQTNDLGSNNIRSGTHLLVPVAAQDASRYAALERSARPASRSITYKVKGGDSLWTIARNHNVTVAQVTQWNGLKNGTVIKPGQKLVLREGSITASGGKQVRTVRYTVRKGDSLYLISRKFNVSVTELRAWNGLAGNKYLQPGQRLKVHVDVTQQSVASRG